MNCSPMPEYAELDAMLKEAAHAGASATLRESGSLRMLGDLQLQSLESGKSLLFGEEVYALRTTMLEPVSSPEEAGPMVQVAWPSEILERHRRQDLRVASPGLPPLDAQVGVGGRLYSAKVLNLSETGIGLGFPQSFPLVLRAHLDVDTMLPGGIAFQILGEVRHMEILEGEALPLRVGVVMGSLEGPSRERMRRFIQARRTELSGNLRRAGDR